jgi:3-hydroxyacyl-CoA dehydrogenase / enoyl-CoA hydratase / 3-hydroxybutyryl-CoA epimerase
MYIYKAAVIGAGTMGAQIAQTITYSGLPVVLKDLKPDTVEKGLETIRKIYQSRVEKGKMTSGEVEQKMSLVTGTTDYDGFNDVDVVIEAIFEDMNVKKKVFGELDSVCPSATILATNTSSLSISEIASATGRPQKVIGMHFFNPAHVMKLVEVIPGLQTSQETIDDTVAFAEGLRKIPVRVQECAGFLVNRLLMPYLNEAAFALQEGAGSARKMDEALVAFGMPMGPFTLLDLIGIDVAEQVAGILYDAYGPRMTAADILSHLVAAKRFGSKVGVGIYQYSDKKDEQLTEILKKIQKKTGTEATSFSPERLLLPMINEAAFCLQEHVASAGDIDLAMIAGTGFPQDKGGPLHYADQLGLDAILEKLQRYSQELGSRFWPAPILKRMVGAGYLGVKAKQGFFSY